MTEVAKIQTPPAEAPMVSMIERVALDPNLPVDRLQSLLDMQERVIDRENRAEHARAKALAMADMPTIPMTGKGHNGRPYSTLKDITSATRPVLSAHGLSLTFDAQVAEQQIIITARLTHANGWEDRVSLSLPFDSSGSKSAVQSIGSSQTYGQRYTAQAILGLSMGEDTDDDGLAGAGEPITADQYRALRAKIETAGADESKLCAFFKIDALHDLPQTKYGTADAMLDKKIADREQTNA